MGITPELLRFRSGEKVTAENWEMRRQEIIGLFADNMFGRLPARYASGRALRIGQTEEAFMGLAKHETIAFSVTGDRGSYEFPLHLFTHNDGRKRPIFLYLGFYKEPYNKYCPVETVLSCDYELAEVCYQEITSDDGNYENGVAGVLTRPQDGTGFSKITLWAWTLSHIIDYLQTRSEIDGERISVIGFSRLGKAALWCSANDPRIYAVFSHESGCAGAALEQTKHEGAETYRYIYDTFPFWFCENFAAFAHGERVPFFDHHLLIAASAPRLVCIHSAAQNAWEDPYAEQLCCIAADDAWRLHGLRGFAGEYQPAKVGDTWYDGHIGYYLREGVHFLSLANWNKDIEFLRKHG